MISVYFIWIKVIYFLQILYFLPWECLYFRIFFALHFCFVVFSIKEYSSESSFECITSYAMWHNTWNTYLDSRNVVHSIVLFNIARNSERITLSTTYHNHSDLIEEHRNFALHILHKTCVLLFWCWTCMLLVYHPLLPE